MKFIEVIPAGLEESDSNKPQVNPLAVVSYTVWDDGSHTELLLAHGSTMIVVGDISEQLKAAE